MATKVQPKEPINQAVQNNQAHSAPKRQLPRESVLLAALVGPAWRQLSSSQAKTPNANSCSHQTGCPGRKPSKPKGSSGHDQGQARLAAWPSPARTASATRHGVTAGAGVTCRADQRDAPLGGFIGDRGPPEP